MQMPIASAEDRLEMTNINPADARNHSLLRSVQGNILKSHGRDFSVHLFLNFKVDSESARNWVRQFSENYVTSAMDQYDMAREHRGCRDRVREGEMLKGIQDPKRIEQSIVKKCAGEPFVSFMLSVSGYKALGFSGNQIPNDARFRLGMKHDDVRNWLHDPHFTDWEPGFQEQLDALVILAHDLDPNESNVFKDLVAHISQEAETVADIVNTEYGHVIRQIVDDKTGKTRTMEHFGYVDGISQPIFYDYEVDKAGGLTRWDPSAPLKLVLSEDPNGHGPDSFGSYFVYRKLQQDVDGFNRRVGELAAALKIGEDLARAYVMGRFKNGTPVVKYRESRKRTAYQSRLKENDFSYAIDPMGNKCPYHAHIRKANPRGEKPAAMMSWTERLIAKREWLRRLFPEVQERWEMGLRMERDRRIARRGIPYGPEHSESGERGLLFLCAQGDIASQYEFLQAVWFNKNIFLKDETGLDAVIGQGYQQFGGQWWPKKWGGLQWPARWERPHWPLWKRNLSRRMTTLTRKQFDFSGYVTLKGGEYFFAPSIDFLRNI